MSPGALASATAYFSLRLPPPQAACPPPFTSKGFCTSKPLNSLEQGGTEARHMGQQRRHRRARRRRLLSGTALLLRAHELPPRAHEAEWDESVDALHAALAFLPPPNYRRAPLRSQAHPVAIEPPCRVVCSSCVVRARRSASQRRQHGDA